MNNKEFSDNEDETNFNLIQNSGDNEDNTRTLKRKFGKQRNRKGRACTKKKNSETATKSLEDQGLSLIPNNLSDHEESQCVPNGKKFVECFICRKTLTKIYKLRQHMQLHTCSEGIDEKKLERSSIYGILNPHQRNIETKVIRDFLAEEILEKRYSQLYGILNEESVELHISDSETDSDSGSLSGKDIPKNTYNCDICKIDFDRRYKALFHQKVKHSNSKLDFACEYCGYRCIGVELLIHHLKTQCESDEKPITCVERFKRYLLKVNLEQFESLAKARKEVKIQRLTTAQKIYTCNDCQKTFTRSEHLTRHRAVHLPEDMKFECPVCYRRFNRKDNMRSHMKVHMDEAKRDNSTQPILCQYCGHCFSSKSNYVVHMRRHTGEKPYKCDVCGKGFPKSSDLNSHKITHSGEKKFICNICNKSFARSAVLSKHMRTHAGPFHCNLCKQSFPRPNELAIHLLTHANGEGSYTCLICSCKFSSGQDLEAHVLSSGHNNLSSSEDRSSHLFETTTLKGQRKISKENITESIDPEEKSLKLLNKTEHGHPQQLASAGTSGSLGSEFNLNGAGEAIKSFLNKDNTKNEQRQQENNIYESWQ